MKIAILTFYFGEFSNYFDVWLKGVEGNPDYDFIFYTDNRKKYDYPLNMKVNYCSFDAIRDRVQKHFDFTISLEKPYKFTDFKPAFGVIFKEDINGYDYWGYVDQDVILGNISKFITEDILASHDRILTRDHLSIYRNTHEIALRFKTESKKYGNLYKTVFESPEIFCFGERGHYGTYHIWTDKGWTIYDQPITADISYKKHYFQLTDSEGYENTQSPKQLFALTVEEGRSCLKQYSAKNNQVYEREFLYMHLQKRKMSVERKNMSNKDLYFIISPNRIIQVDETIANRLNESAIEKYVGRIDPVKDFIRYYKRGKIKFTKFLRQLKYK